MSGETDLNKLIAEMRPVLSGEPYVFYTLPEENTDWRGFNPLGIFHETEGVTIIVTQRQARDSGWPLDSAWACISLTVHSALSAVGFLAAVLGRLALAGISVNPVSAYYHDHLFVPWENRDRAMDVLEELSNPRGLKR
jgi:hypothetical protein